MSAMNRQVGSEGWFIRGLSVLDAGLGYASRAAAFLVIPLAALLCLQWPLRDWVHAYSLQANDTAQLLFGVYISFAIAYAGRRRVHLTPDVVARRYPRRVRELVFKATSSLIMLPWTGFILYAAAPSVWQSVKQLESFPETFNAGYFVLKISVWLLALLLLLQTVVDIVDRRAPDEEGRAR